MTEHYEPRDNQTPVGAPSLHGGGPCARCGHDPACGWSMVGDKWFCHADDHSCYQSQSYDDSLAWWGDRYRVDVVRKAASDD